MVVRNFIVFEGIDGAGTSTQLTLLKERAGTDTFLFTAEPTSASTGRYLRQMLKGDIPLQPETAAYLFAADRNEHINGNLLIEGDRRLVTGVRAACAQGSTVVSDRYLFSSLAYQSVNGDPRLPRQLNRFFPLPQLLFYFAIEPEQSLARIQGRGVQEIYEKRDFLQKTVREYDAILREYAESGMDIIRIDATRPQEEISEFIWKEIQKSCGMPIIRG